jgi:hypothetical protein
MYLVFYGVPLVSEELSEYEKREVRQYDGDSTMAKLDSTMVTRRQYDGEARYHDGDKPSYCRSVTIVLSPS